MKKIFTTLILLILLTSNVFAGVQEDIDKLKSDLENIKNQKITLDADIKKAESQKGTVLGELNLLNLELAKFQNQIDTLNIETETKSAEINAAANEIALTESKILKQETEIISEQEESKKRILDIYLNIVENQNSLAVISSTSINELISKLEYQNILKNQNEEQIQKLQTLRLANIENKKLLLAKKDKIVADKEQIEKNKLEVLAIKATIDEKAIERANVLNKVTSVIGNNQNVIDQLSTKEKSIEARMLELQSQLFTETKTTGSDYWVKKGDIIGIQGNTGYSYGAHLHFFVGVNGKSYEDPCTYLTSGILGECGGNGQLAYPMKDTNWSRGFTSSHPAIDIWSSGDENIYAAHDGWLIRGKEQCQSWYPVCNYGGANYVIICEEKDCVTGFKTGYWHLKY